MNLTTFRLLLEYTSHFRRLEMEEWLKGQCVGLA